jgi:hypothetical protein
MWGLRRLVFLFWRPAESYALYSQRSNPPPAQPWTFQRPGFAMMLCFIFKAFLSSASLLFPHNRSGPHVQPTSLYVPIKM